MNVEIRSDIGKIGRLLDEDKFKSRFVDRANESMRNSIDDLNDKVQSKFNIKVREVNENYFVIASMQDGHYNKRGGVMTFNPAQKEGGTARAVFKGSPINLSRFATTSLTSTVVKVHKKNKRSGPKVKILRSGSPHSIKGSFKATTKSGHTGIFKRRSDGRIIELREITYASMAKQVDFDKIFNIRWSKNIATLF